jgi:hypothetical protein
LFVAAQIKDLIRMATRPSKEQIKAFQALADKYPAVAMIKAQHHGEWVHVPAGWLHMVSLDRRMGWGWGWGCRVPGAGC